MTTTSHFQTVSDYYSSIENIFKDDYMEFWDGYKDIDATNVLQTFRYLFHKFKKGIFIKIVDNELKVFLPFSNVNFINEWSCNIKIDPKYNNLYNFIKYTNDIEKRTLHKNCINEFINTWYGNNCLVRYEYPIKETDTNTSVIKDMLEELCKNRKLPDIEFFINRRDFPLLTKNYTEPYYHLWNDMNKSLVSHKYKKYVPILSMCKSDNFADILIPSHEDWGRVQVENNKFFPKCHVNFNCNFNNNWDEKKPTAVFRGSSTGYGVDINTNNRLKISYLSTITKPDVNNIPYIDAGITKWNARPRKFIDSEYLQTIEVETLPFGLVNPLTPLEQSNYKYIIHIDGHVSAFRLSYELNMNSVVLLVNSDWKIWYSHLLKPYIHYIPIENDLSDIITKIKWCRDNDDKCKEIASNAREFYNKYLSKKSIFDYMQKLLVNLKKHTGTYIYNYIKPLNIQIRKEYKYIKNIPTKNDVFELPMMGRSYALLTGIKLALNTFESIQKNVIYQREIFMNKLGKVNLYDFKGFKLSIKNTTDHNKINEHIHETFIGLSCINKLLKKIPNFVYVFGSYKNKNKYNVITEYIKGQTLKDYITSDNFCFEEFIFIILQICLALHIAQKECCFVHNDMTPWNIILQRLKTPIYVDYVVSHKKIIRIKTDIIPVIIDYGKSHVVYNNEHYGYVNMFNFSYVNDIFSLLVTTIYQISLEKQLSKENFGYLLKLSNFLCNSTYKKDNFTNSKELKIFLYNMKKYSNLISEHKHELESKTPLYLFYYIRKNIKHNYDINNVTDYFYSMNNGDSQQVFEYIISKNTQEQLQSYLNYFSSVLKNINIDTFNNDLLFTYYIAQNTLKDVNYMCKIFKQFLSLKNINSAKYIKEVNNKISSIKSYFEHKISKCVVNTYNYKNTVLEYSKYNEDIFLVPDNIVNLLSKYEDTTELKDLIQIIEYVLISNEFKIKHAHRNIILNNYYKLLELDIINIQLYNSYNNSLMNNTLKIYNKNKKCIESIKNSELDAIYNKYNEVITLISHKNRK
jgi:hypothetical protein